MRGQFEGTLYLRARSNSSRINGTVCVMRGLFEGAVYSEGANYSRKYGISVLEITSGHRTISG